MKKAISVLILLGLSSCAFADYTYTKGSVCTGTDCSTQTCHVTEYDEQVVTTSEMYTDTEVISELYDYLVDQGEDMYADRLMHLLDIQCIEKKKYTVTETKKQVPDPTEACSRSEPICGNGVIDSELGEECDKGAEKNGKEGVSCTQDCKLSTVFDVEVYDPVLCDGHFQGGVDLPSGDYENVNMFLKVMCGDDTEYTSLNPSLDKNGQYIALLNYTDPTASNYQVGNCKVKYGAMYQGLRVEKEAMEFLEGGCKEGGGNGSTSGTSTSGTSTSGTSTGGSTTGSSTGSSSGSNGGPVVNEDGSITVYSSISSPIGGSHTPQLSNPISGPIGGINDLHSSAPMHESGGSDANKSLVLDPAAQHLAPPKILEKTGAGGFRGSIF